MDSILFDQLLKECHPGQNAKEWQYFIEFVSNYFKVHNIENPIVVELGVRGGCQRCFYEQILGAKYIGIDIDETYAKPDILGNTHDPQTLKRLNEILGGKPINLLFIDADHSYNAVKKDFGIYGVLTKNLIAFHDVRTEGFGVMSFWEELLVTNNAWVKIMFYQKNILRPYQYGIGVIVKE